MEGHLQWKMQGNIIFFIVLLFHCARRLTVIFLLVKSKHHLIFHKRLSIMTWYFKRLVLLLFLNKLSLRLTLLICWTNAFCPLKKKKISVTDPFTTSMSLCLLKGQMCTPAWSCLVFLAAQRNTSFTVNKMQFDTDKSLWIYYTFW